MEEQISRKKIIEFKNFINNHPKLLVHVRKNGLTWQDYFEQWLLLGEEDSSWDEFRRPSQNKQAKDSPSKENLEKIDQFINQIDIAKVQKGLKGLNDIISTIDGILKNYLENKGQTSPGSGDFFQNFKD